jgi:hypothetical protein
VSEFGAALRCAGSLTTTKCGRTNLRTMGFVFGEASRPGRLNEPSRISKDCALNPAGTTEKRSALSDQVTSRAGPWPAQSLKGASFPDVLVGLKFAWSNPLFEHDQFGRMHITAVDRSVMADQRWGRCGTIPLLRNVIGADDPPPVKNDFAPLVVRKQTASSGIGHF